MACRGRRSDSARTQAREAAYIAAAGMGRACPRLPCCHAPVPPGAGGSPASPTTSARPPGGSSHHALATPNAAHLFRAGRRRCQGSSCQPSEHLDDVVGGPGPACTDRPAAPGVPGSNPLSRCTSASPAPASRSRFPPNHGRHQPGGQGRCTTATLPGAPDRGRSRLDIIRARSSAGRPPWARLRRRMGGLPMWRTASPNADALACHSAFAAVTLALHHRC
jgi:hypothetical protein